MFFKSTNGGNMIRVEFAEEVDYKCLTINDMMQYWQPLPYGILMNMLVILLDFLLHDTLPTRTFVNIL